MSTSQEFRFMSGNCRGSLKTINFNQQFLKKIPTEVEVVPRYKLLKLFTLLTLFNLFTLFTLFTLFSKQCLHNTYVLLYE